MPKITPAGKLYLLCIILLLCLGACIHIEEITQTASTAAGKSFTSKIKIRLSPNRDFNAVHFIFAVLTPNSWDLRKAEVSFESTKGNGAMSPVALNATVAGKQLNWPAYIMHRYGIGPNRLDDMKWTVFQTRQTFTAKTKEPDITGTVTIKMGAGADNEVVRLGYYISSDLPGVMNPDTVRFADKLTVTGAKGAVVNYDVSHLAAICPMSGGSRRRLTVYFDGNAAPNPLATAHAVYFVSVAYAKNKQTVTRLAPNDENRLAVAGNNRWTLQLDPAAYYGLTERDMDRIEYRLTDRSGQLIVGTAGSGKPFVYHY